MPALLFIVLPLIEIAGFILVGQWLGVLPTIGLAMLTSVLGAVLLRVQGLGILGRIRTEAEAGRVPGVELANGLVVLLAALLLFLPGFFTDLIGLLLFIPAIRNAAWRFFGRRITIVGSRFAAGAPPWAAGRGGAKTIDLDQADYHADQPPAGPRDPDSPWRRLDRP